MQHHPRLDRARPQLAAAAIDILPGRVAQLGEDAALEQRAGDVFAAFPLRALSLRGVAAILRGKEPFA